MAQSNVVAFRWRTSTAAQPAQWKRGTHEWVSGTLDDLRRALAPTCGSTTELAVDNDPQLWACDRNGNLAPEPQGIPADVLLSWSPATCPPELFRPHENGRPGAVLLFTFPPEWPQQVRLGMSGRPHRQSRRCRSGRMQTGSLLLRPL